MKSINEAIRDRFILLCIRPEEILELLGDWKHREYVSLPDISGLPADAMVSGVEYSFPHQAFVVRVHHESFKEVPAGHYPAVHQMRYETVKIVVMPTQSDIPMVAIDRQ